MNRLVPACVIVLGAAACSTSTGLDAGPPARTLAEFESQLDRMRVQLAIPGMSAIVMEHDAVVWEGSLGVADIASQGRVTPETQFHLASLTKTFASTIVLQLVEQELIDLDDPISDYGLDVPGPGVVRVRHLLSHTSEGVPGDQFRYSGDRFALLDHVIQQATGESFATRVMDRIVTPLELHHTAPNPRDAVSLSSGANKPFSGAAASNLLKAPDPVTRKGGSACLPSRSSGWSALHPLLCLPVLRPARSSRRSRFSE